MLVPPSCSERKIYPRLAGYRAPRRTVNWREHLIAEKFDELCKYGTTPRGILANGDDFQKLSEKEKEIAEKAFLSAIQWLGTNVGFSVLKELLNEIGCDIDEAYIEESLTSQNPTARHRAAERLAKIDKAKEQCEENLLSLRKDFP